MSKIKVSKAAWSALEAAYTKITDNYPELKKRWNDQCSTSVDSDAAGGMVTLETDYDWLLLFFAWSYGAAIPRDKGKGI